jgi:hypothetical protein
MIKRNERITGVHRKWNRRRELGIPCEHKERVGQGEESDPIRVGIEQRVPENK